MKDEGKTKEQLMADSASPTELAEVHQRIAELEAAEAERKRAEDRFSNSQYGSLARKGGATEPETG